MKKILLLLIVMLTETFSYAQSTVTFMDSTDYYPYFFDQFLYTSLTGTSTASTLLYPAGTPFTDVWTIKNTSTDDFNWGSTIFDVSHVTLLNPGIRFTENTLPCTTCSLNHISGAFYLNPTVGYGIVEALIKYPDPEPYSTGAAVAFWTNGPKYTEIDIMDNGYNDGAISYTARLIDWYYASFYPLLYNDGSGNPLPFKVNSLVHGTAGTGWHTYAAKWTPTDVTYYIDDIAKQRIPYTDVRIYPEAAALLFLLGASPNTIDGQTTDIAWVKIWRKKCEEGTINVAADPINPGMIKQDLITSSSSFLTRTEWLNATILESEATTIQPNFLADESVPQLVGYHLPYPDNPAHPIYRNGFLLILPSNCIGGETETGYRKINNSNGENDIPADAANYSVPAHNTGDSSFADFTQIQVYPNPAQNTVTISYPCNSAGQLEIKISDVTGQVMYMESVSCAEGGNTEQTVDISSFCPGVYFIELTLNDQNVVKKIVKL